MIQSFQHKGLEKFFLTGSKAGIQSEHARKLQIILTRLHAATCPEDMDAPGFRLHPLKHNLKDFWSVWVNANWRVIFKFEGEDAVLVDYRDYR